MTVLISTTCAGLALEYFGITGTTWNNRTRKNVWKSTLRRAGLSVRSRMSSLTKSEKTVGAARSKISQLASAEPDIIAFVVSVKGHVLVVDRDGRTIVDSSPRKRDARRVLGIVAVFNRN